LTGGQGRYEFTALGGGGVGRPTTTPDTIKRKVRGNSEEGVSASQEQEEGLLLSLLPASEKWKMTIREKRGDLNRRESEKECEKWE